MTETPVMRRLRILQFKLDPELEYGGVMDNLMPRIHKTSKAWQDLCEAFKKESDNDNK